MEIRRSVMARPSLSVRTSGQLPAPSLGLVIANGKETQAGHPRQVFPFQWLLAKPGGAGVSTSTLGRPVARAPWLAYSLPRRRNQGIPEGYGSRKLTAIIESRRTKEVSRFQSFFDGGLGEHGHHFVPGGVRVKAIIGQIAFKKSLLVDHGRERLTCRRNSGRRRPLVAPR